MMKSLFLPKAIEILLTEMICGWLIPEMPFPA